MIFVLSFFRSFTSHLEESLFSRWTSTARTEPRCSGRSSSWTGSDTKTFSGEWEGKKKCRKCVPYQVVFAQLITRLREEQRTMWTNQHLPVSLIAHYPNRQNTDNQDYYLYILLSLFRAFLTTLGLQSMHSNYCRKARPQTTLEVGHIYLFRASSEI